MKDSHFAYKSLCVSASGGSGGKTLLSLGLCVALSARGIVVKPFKKGPDYIDSAWLGKACGMAATNLDPFFLPASDLRRLFYESLAIAYGQKAGNGPLFALIEGNRGLYDGLDEKGSCSTAELARIVDSPILLCLDCAKVTRTVAALLQGLVNFEKNLRFVGVILNRVGSQRHERALRSAIEYNTDLRVLGTLPRIMPDPMPERHMGLETSGDGLDQKTSSLLRDLGRLINENCDLDRLLELLPEQVAPACAKPPLAAKNPDRPVIAYIRDRAFWFYYPENLTALEEAGAKLLPLGITDDSPANSHLWTKFDGLYLGGGFPEDFADILAASPRLALIRQFADAGMPIYAECGGLMLLCRNLRLPTGDWSMCGVFNCQVEWSKRPQGLGYVEAVVTGSNPYFELGRTLRGHEFHYSRCSLQGKGDFCLAVARGRGIVARGDGKAWDGLLYKNVWGSYTHIFAPAISGWAKNFVAAASGWRKQPDLITRV